jgi:hypothetical protein
MSVKDLIMELSNITFEHSESIPSGVFKQILDKTKEVYDKIETEEKTVNIPPRNHLTSHIRDVRDYINLDTILEDFKEIEDCQTLINGHSSQIKISSRNELKEKSKYNDERIHRYIELCKSLDRGRHRLVIHYYTQKKQYIKRRYDNSRYHTQYLELQAISEKIDLLNNLKKSMENCSARCNNGELCKNRARKFPLENYRGIGFCNRHNNKINVRINELIHRPRFWENREWLFSDGN